MWVVCNDLSEMTHTFLVILNDCQGLHAKPSSNSSPILDCFTRDRILNHCNENESMCNSVSLECKPFSLRLI